MKTAAVAALAAAFALGVLARPPLADLYRSASKSRPQMVPGEPAPRELHRHAAFLRNLDRRPRDAPVVLLGDSVTECWFLSPDHLTAAFGPDVVNLGVGSDRVEHVRWRVANGELDPARVRPKRVVVCVGVNNLWAGHPPAAVRDAVAALVADVRSLQPAAEVVLLALTPAGETPADPLRRSVAELNSLLPSVPGVTFVPAGGSLVEPGGRIDPSVMPDFVHPSPEGYRRWAAELAPHFPR